MEHVERLIVIIGPTASGKTGLAVELARHIGGEVVSADSRQVYRGLDIGTEKVVKCEMRGVLHHCIDIASPRRSFSVTQWRSHAERAVRGIQHRGHIPIVAGGTGLYVDALVYGTVFPDVKPNGALRQRLAKLSPEALFAELSQLDPARAATVEHANPRRLIRAIEVATALGRVPPLVPAEPRFAVTWIGLNPDREVLEERIAERLDRALRRGLVAETKRLRDELHLSPRRINELGMEYRVCAAYLRGELPKEALRSTLVREVCRYAKRQMTWFRQCPGVAWYPSRETALEAYTAKQRQR